MGRSTDLRKMPWWLIPFFVLLVPLGLSLLALVLLLHFLATACFDLAWWSWWNPRGRDILFVYSDRPLWKNHVEADILPFIQKRAVIVNLSERRRSRLAFLYKVFRRLGVHDESLPHALVFRPFRRTRVFRFWKPFRHLKAGRVETLQHIEAEFFDLVDV